MVVSNCKQVWCKQYGAVAEQVVAKQYGTVLQPVWSRLWHRCGVQAGQHGWTWVDLGGHSGCRSWRVVCGLCGVKHKQQVWLFLPCEAALAAERAVRRGPDRSSSASPESGGETIQ